MVQIEHFRPISVSLDTDMGFFCAYVIPKARSPYESCCFTNMICVLTLSRVLTANVTSNSAQLFNALY